ncbi:YrhB domain-containing protein [Actinoallomurus iriomotensis]|uniref:YrhB domain-containing protein n=1 Tax=Actinoallomurus iriomotensis TaxID=478107 RepID=UPI0025527746|nr:YrhB domain-containing protein [Actinoallomurus iriomotensis]
MASSVRSSKRPVRFTSTISRRSTSIARHEAVLTVISRDEADRIARDYVAREFPPMEGAEDIVIDDAATIERPYGWLFTCATATYVRTRDPDQGLAGVGPLLVLREDGRIIPYTSIYTNEAALREYEQQRE